MKRKPNGFGTIRKFGGNRLNPYGVFGPSYKSAGKRKRDTIGWFQTIQEAEYALAKWQRTQGTKVNYSLEDLYEDWSDLAYRELSRSTVLSYQAAWKKLDTLYKMKVRNIRSVHFQRIVDTYVKSGKSWSSLHDIKVLAGLLEKYAMEFDIIEKNYAEFITLPQKVEKEKEAFTEKQVEVLEKAAKNDFMAARLIVILIYTGWRISELLALTPDDYDPVSNTLMGGMKTESGKNRTVPIAPDIQPYIDELIARAGCRLVCREQPHGRGKNRWVELVPMSAAYFREKLFKPTLDALGIHQSDGSDFTPHATRHTFATRARKSGADPLVTKKILGHSPKADVTEKVYTHIDLDMMNAAMSIISQKNQKK